MLKGGKERGGIGDVRIYVITRCVISICVLSICVNSRCV